MDTHPFPLAETENVQVQVVPCVIRSKGFVAPKILKKKSSINKLNKEPNLKKVTFEVRMSSVIVSNDVQLRWNSY